MRIMKIVVPTMKYATGEEITGFLEIECDEPFDSSKTETRITGVIYAKGSKTEVYSSGAKIRQRKVEKKIKTIFLELQSTISEDRRYEIGKHRVEFSMTLPETVISLEANKIQERGSLYPSYEGEDAWIKYSLHANVKLSRISSMYDEIPIYMTIPVEGLRKAVEESFIGQRVEGAIMDGGTNIMDISIDSTIYCIDSPFRVRYRLNTLKNIKRFSFELFESNLIHVEDVFSGNSETIRYVPKFPEDVEVNEWQVLILNPRHTACQHFKSEVLKIVHGFTATAELGRSKKPYINFPLLAFHCPVNLKQKLSDTESSKKAQNKCPHCEAELSVDGLIRPDGMVICPKCFKKFEPEQV